MAPEEARTLEPGDRVEAFLRPRTFGSRPAWYPCRVVRAHRARVTVRPVETALFRRADSARTLAPMNVRRPPGWLAANVFADFLEEQGEHRAAALLRKELPLVVPSP